MHQGLKGGAILGLQTRRHLKLPWTPASKARGDETLEKTPDITICRWTKWISSKVYSLLCLPFSSLLSVTVVGANISVLKESNELWRQLIEICSAPTPPDLEVLSRLSKTCSFLNTHQTDIIVVGLLLFSLKSSYDWAVLNLRISRFLCSCR